MTPENRELLELEKLIKDKFSEKHHEKNEHDWLEVVASLQESMEPVWLKQNAVR